MTIEKIKLLQHWAGVPEDGVIGPQTIDALLVKAGLVAAPKAHALQNLEAFYKAVRLITGPLDQIQVDTINGLLAAGGHWPIGWLAYGFATAWHEARLKPIEEIGRGRGKPYGQPGKYGQAQYGRGLVQLTWDRNYEWADKALGLGGTLLQNFDRALEPDIATAILVKGMETGAFTGRKLADYIDGHGTRPQFTEARRIINSTDRAALIAGYADEFQESLRDGGWA